MHMACIKKTIPPTILQTHCQLVYHISFTKNYSAECMEGKENEQIRDEQTGRSELSNPRYNLALSFCIPNMIFLSMVMKISLTKM